MKITYKGLQDAINNNYPVTVIINGEHYDFEKEVLNDAIIDGASFAAAVFEDRRARASACLGYKATKKAKAENEALNQEIKNQCEMFKRITLCDAAFPAYFKDYKDGKLWKLKDGV